MVLCVPSRHSAYQLSFYYLHCFRNFETVCKFITFLVIWIPSKFELTRTKLVKSGAKFLVFGYASTNLKLLLKPRITQSFLFDFWIRSILECNFAMWIIFGTRIAAFIDLNATQQFLAFIARMQLNSTPTIIQARKIEPLGTCWHNLQCKIYSKT